MIILFLLCSILVCVLRFWSAFRNAKKVKRENVKQEAIVLARVKEKRESIWVCKFFKCGNHYGFFREKPKSDRVEAVIVGYDKGTDMYELKEVY